MLIPEANLWQFQKPSKESYNVNSHLLSSYVNFERLEAINWIQQKLKLCIKRPSLLESNRLKHLEKSNFPKFKVFSYLF